MRLDELPRSDNVEDRRGDGSGGFPMGRTGGGIGTIILLGLIGTALPGCGRTTQRKSGGSSSLATGCKLQYLPGGAALTHDPPNPDLAPSSYVLAPRAATQRHREPTDGEVTRSPLLEPAS